MRRILLALVAMIIPVTALTVGFAGTAGAAGGSITCTTITGTASSTIVVSGCKGGNTGGNSAPITALALATGGTINWVSGSSTTIAAPALSTVKNTKCPGYTKPPKGTTPPEPTAEKFVATVNADTGDGVLLPATATGEVCIATTGDITALTPMVTTWHPSTIKCTTIDGTIATITVSGCTGGFTGGNSTAMDGTTLATGGTIDWVSGSNTTIAAPTLKTVAAKKCPGYTKPAKGTTPPEPTAESFSAVVTADSGDGLALPGKATGEVCIGTDGSITALKGLAAS
jgi:hypothetical protein